MADHGIETYERKKDPSACTLQVRRCPKALRNSFKAKCALLEVDMSEKIISLMRTFVAEKTGGK